MADRVSITRRCALKAIPSSAIMATVPSIVRAESREVKNNSLDYHLQQLMAASEIYDPSIKRWEVHFSPSHGDGCDEYNCAVVIVAFRK